MWLFRGSGSEQTPIDQSPPTSQGKELNGHVYELYKPPTGDANVEILFFHGLQFKDTGSAYLSTWTSRNESKQVWPGTWLAKEFPSAHIFSMSYDSLIRTTLEGGRSDLFNLAENLINAICLASIGQGSRCPVILVGHSFGGLVIKKVCVEADHQHSLDPGSWRNKMIGNFLKNLGLGGIFFYGTPHRGSALADVAAHFLKGHLLAVVQTLSVDAARLEAKFSSVCKKHKIQRIAAIGELLPTKWGLCNCVIVPEASARYGAEFCTVDEDHISLCKPIDTTSISFQNLVAFIQSIKVQGEGVQGAGPTLLDNIQWIPKEAVGLDHVVEMVREKLKSASNLGIIGMGGVGKTTLVKAIFNKLNPTFEYTSFVANMKLIPGSTTHIKGEVWKHMHYRGKKLATGDKEGSWHDLRGARLLLVLDDVGGGRDLEVLSQIIDNNGASKNCVIVTSRDQELLSCLDDVYEVPFLNNDNAKQLFMSHAFPKQAQPPPSLKAHVEAIVRKCDGLPLTLEILGKYLRRKVSIEIWKQSLEALDKADEVFQLDEKLWAKLRLSYDGLGEKEQQMFLDAATFFFNTLWKLREAKVAWSMSYGLEDVRWQTLVDMSLVYDVGEDDYIRMHEQLQSLGKKIASTTGKHGKCKRIWDPTLGGEILQSIDEGDDDVEEIVALNLQYSVFPLRREEVPATFNIWNALSRFKNLQLLDFRSRGGVTTEPLHQESFPSNLVLLRIHIKDLNQLPFNPSSLKRLAVLKVDIPDLKSLPSSFGQLSALKILFIAAEELESLPESFGQLSRLQRLDINCERLRTLPASFGQLATLKVLAFSYCKALRTLPETFGQLGALEQLMFRFGQFHALPESFGQLAALKRLTFVVCQNLTTLPESICQLAALEHLSFHYCISFRALPESLGGLPALKHLHFYACHELSMLPDSIGQLAQMERLTISDCSSLEWLPDSVGELAALQYLHIEWAHIKYVPNWIQGLPSLQTLVLGGLPHLERFPSWLGDGTPPLSSRKTFHVQEASFVLALEEKLDSKAHWFWFYERAVAKVRILDHAGALAAMAIVDPEDLHVRDATKGFVLQERGIIKRLMGDLDGALEDLNAAFSKYSDTSGKENYYCRMQRGFVKYLKGDIEGARDDGKKALEILEPSLAPLSIASSSLGEQPLEYLNFKLVGPKEIKDLQLMIDSKHSEAMDKAEAMDYTGALADLDSIDLETAFLHWPAFALQGLLDRQQFVLQEKGVLKRLMGDLDGALRDLTALETDFKKGKYDYERRKHRGYVKYLMGDLEGARNDAQRALKIKPSRVDRKDYGIKVLEGGEERLKFLGGESLNYLEFNLR